MGGGNFYEDCSYLSGQMQREQSSAVGLREPERVAAQFLLAATGDDVSALLHSQVHCARPFGQILNATFSDEAIRFVDSCAQDL